MSDFSLYSICDSWSRETYDDTTSLIRWNQEAEKFGAMPPPEMDNSLCLQMLQQEGVLEAGGSGLDVGCGGGRYSFALEKLGFSMHGTDFSPNMIAQAEKNRDRLGSHATFSVDNWHELDIREKGWDRHFDLVLAHMTPAVVDARSFRSLIRASRGTVFLQKPTRWRSPIQEELCSLLGVLPGQSRMDASFAQAFSMAWLMGYSPKTGYREETWETEMELDSAVTYYLGRMSGFRHRKPGDAEKVRAYLKERFPDGRVLDVTHTHIAALLFRVNEEETK